MAFLDPSQFSIDPEGSRSFQDRLLELRRSLPPEIQAQQPPIPGIPQQTQQESQQAGLASQINRAAGQIPPGAQQPTPVTAQQPAQDPLQGLIQQSQQILGPKITQQLMKEATNLDPPKLVGPDVFGRGGIMGTGLEPIDVLAFAIGAAVTSRLPQNQAMERTMQIAQLPSMFKQNQRKAATDWIGQATGAANAQTSMANAQVAQTKASQVQRQYQSRLQLAEAYRQAGRAGDALAIEADAVNEHMKLTGQGVDKLPPNLQYIMSGVATGAIRNIPQEIMNVLGARTPEEAQKLAEAWIGGHLLTQPITPLPDIGGAMRTPSGPVIVERAPVAPSPGSLQDIRSRTGQIRSGQAPAQVPAGPAQQAAPTTQVPPLTAPSQPGAAPIAPTAPQQPDNFISQLGSSPSPQDQWTAKYAADLPPNIQQNMRPLYQRPMSAETRQRLIAQRATLDYGQKLASDYNTMVKSFGGDAKYTLKPRLTQYLMNLGTRISGEGISGGGLTLLSDAASYLAQEHGTPLTPEALQFIGTFAQAQKFARGAMNDAANLATRERTMFNLMVGTPLDKPSVFRARVNSFVSEIAKEHNAAIKANQLFNTEGWQPVDLGTLPGAKKAEPKRAIPTPRGELPPGWETFTRPQTSGGEY